MFLFFLYSSLSQCEFPNTNFFSYLDFFWFLKLMVSLANVMILYEIIKCFQNSKTIKIRPLGSYPILNQAYLPIIIVNVGHASLGKIYKIFFKHFLCTEFGFKHCQERQHILKGFPCAKVVYRTMVVHSWFDRQVLLSRMDDYPDN